MNFLKRKNVSLPSTLLLFLLVFSPFLGAQEEGPQLSDENVSMNLETLEKTPSSEFVRLAWEASHHGNLGRLAEIEAECFAIYETEALSQQTELQDFPERGRVREYQSMNDVATVMFVRAEALMKQGRTEEAIAHFSRVMQQYPWAQAWDPRGWYWSVAEKSQASIDIMTGKARVVEEEEFVPGLRTLPKLFHLGTEKVVDYTQYGSFQNVGTEQYYYRIDDPVGLSKAVGEGIYPNTGAVLRNPGYRKAQEEGRLEGDHWDFVHSDDLEAAFYKWATAKEPWGVKLFYIGLIFEKAKMYHNALKAYHALVIHFPNAVGWTYWQTPWYPAQASIAKIQHIIRMNPELNLKVKHMKIEVDNGHDNDISNDIVRTYPGVIVKKSWWDIIWEWLKLDQRKVPLRNITRQLGNGRVRLVQYDNGHWELLVEGKPFVIRGITYAPTKVGQSPDDGTIMPWWEVDTSGSGLADGPYEAWVDKNRNNRQDPDEPSVGDFQLLKEMGLNTIREYHQPHPLDKDFLRQMHKRFGFMVAIGDFLGKYTLGSGASWFEGTDYENPEHRKNMMESVRKMVVEHKDEPYLLMWILGNENNYGLACNADTKPEAYFRFANEVAKMIKELDPNHPVALCNGDTLFLDIYAKYAPDIDIFAANVYRGDYGFGSFWEQVQSATGKPAMITEYGCPAYARHLTLEEAEEAQAQYHRGNWLCIESNMAGHREGIGNALGGFIFEWLDEWWKNYEPFYHDKKSDAIGPFPGGYYYEEWFGIAGQGDGSHSSFLRQLRKSYFAYKEMWTGQK